MTLNQCESTTFNIPNNSENEKLEKNKTSSKENVQDELVCMSNIERNQRTDFMKNQIRQEQVLEKPLESLVNKVDKPQNGNKNDKNDLDENYKLNKTCKFFQKGTCRHGISGKDCKFTHPKMCRKFTKHGTRQPHGCNKGKRCEQFHPAMCINSLRKSECYNEHCSFLHIKGTIRDVINNNVINK